MNSQRQNSESENYLGTPNKNRGKYENYAEWDTHRELFDNYGNVGQRVQNYGIVKQQKKLNNITRQSNKKMIEHEISPVFNKAHLDPLILARD